MYINVGRRRFFYGAALALVTSSIGLAHADDPKNGGFRREVIDLFRERYPDRAVEAGSDAMSIKIGNSQITLDNIYKTVVDLNGQERQEAILSFLEFAVKAGSAEPAIGAFDQIKSKLRIQIAPAEFAADNSGILYRTLSMQVIGTVVVDQDSMYQYVSENDVKEWNVSIEQVFKLGIGNLDDKSTNVQSKCFQVRKQMTDV